MKREDLIDISQMGSISRNLMHVTDWFPTILDFGKCSRTSIEKPLDGVSQAAIINSQTINPYDNSPVDQYLSREEILHELNPLAYVPNEIKDPRGDWKSDHDSPLIDRCFGIGVRAAIRRVFQKTSNMLVTRFCW